MKAHILHELNNPLRLVVKTVALIVLLALFVHTAYQQGVQHAIATAEPYVEGDAILIDYDGQVHIYE